MFSHCHRRLEPNLHPCLYSLISTALILSIASINFSMNEESTRSEPKFLWDWCIEIYYLGVISIFSELYEVQGGIARQITAENQLD